MMMPFKDTRAVFRLLIVGSVTVLYLVPSLPRQIDEASLRDERRTLTSVSVPAQISNFSRNSSLISTGDPRDELDENHFVLYIPCSMNISETRMARSYAQRSDMRMRLCAHAQRSFGSNGLQTRGLSK